MPCCRALIVWGILAGMLAAYAVDGNTSASTTQSSIEVSLELTDWIANGSSRALAMDGDFIFVGVGPGVFVLNIEDMGQPHVGGYTGVLSADVNAVAISGDRLYVAAGLAGLRVFEISPPERPRELTAYVDDCSAMDVVLSSSRVFVACGDQGVLIFDTSISLPLSLVDRIDTEWSAVAVDVHDNELLAIAERNPTPAAAGMQLATVRVADGSKPEEVGSVRLDSGGPPQAVSVRDSTIFVSNESGSLLVFDLSPDLYPSEGEHIDFPGRVSDVAWSEDRMIVAGTLLTGRAALRLFRKDAGSRAEEVGAWNGASDGSGGALGVVADGARAVIALSAGGIGIVGMESPTELTEEGAWYFRTRTRGLAVSEGRVYLADLYDTTHMLEIRSPVESLEILGTLRLPSVSLMDVVVEDERVYILDAGGVVHIVDWTVPGEPRVVGGFGERFAQFLALAVSRDVAFVTSDEGEGAKLVMLDVADPSAPRTIGPFVPLAAGAGLAVSGTTVYVADVHGGLRVVDVSTPDTPRIQAVLDEVRGAAGVVSRGRFIYAARLDSASSGGLAIVDVSDTERPWVVGNYALAGGAWDLAIDRDVVFLAARDRGLIVLDVSNPAEPREIERKEDVGAWAVAVEAGKLFVAGEDGLRAYAIRRLDDTPGPSTGTPPPPSATPRGVSTANPILLPVALVDAEREDLRGGGETPTAVPSALPLPDLFVSRLTWCTNPDGGLVIHACVGNSGSANAGPFSNRLAGRSPTGWDRLPGLAPRATACMPYAKPGGLGMFFVVDADDEVEESDETNNSAPIAVPTSQPPCPSVEAPE